MSIYSALVTPEKSEALLRALSTTKDLHDYAIPSAGSDMEIDTSGFELEGGSSIRAEIEGWTNMTVGREELLLPPPRPAEFIIEQMKLESDSDLRIWINQTTSPVMESQIWGYYDEAKRHESTNPNRGQPSTGACFIHGINIEVFGPRPHH